MIKLSREESLELREEIEEQVRDFYRERKNQKGLGINKLVFDEDLLEAKNNNKEEAFVFVVANQMYDNTIRDKGNFNKLYTYHKIVQSLNDIKKGYGSDNFENNNAGFLKRQVRKVEPDQMNYTKKGPEGKREYVYRNETRRDKELRNILKAVEEAGLTETFKEITKTGRTRKNWRKRKILDAEAGKFEYLGREEVSRINTETGKKEKASVYKYGTGEDKAFIVIWQSSDDMYVVNQEDYEDGYGYGLD